jgi:shikimate kinase
VQGATSDAPGSTLVFIVGPPAVGKMTVGYELAAQTGLKLFHNHQTIELVLELTKPTFHLRRMDHAC